MNINEEIELVNIPGKEQLQENFEGISTLFAESFGKPLDKELWEWAYINNPFGEAVVAIALWRGKLVGHYAVVPLDLSRSSDKLNGFLSMTTMVAVDFRMHKLFKRLADMVYARIEATGLPSIVFGFPNDNSAPGFIKRLGWNVSEDYKVVKVKSDEIQEIVNVLDSQLKGDPFTLNLEDKAIMQWRTSKPNQKWEYKNSMGLKSIGNEFDLMHISDSQKLLGNPVNGSINMILRVKDEPQLQKLEVAFPYRFGYRLFNTKGEPNLLVQMSMSDIF